MLWTAFLSIHLTKQENELRCLGREEFVSTVRHHLRIFINYLSNLDQIPQQLMSKARTSATVMDALRRNEQASVWSLVDSVRERSWITITTQTRLCFESFNEELIIFSSWSVLCFGADCWVQWLLKCLEMMMRLPPVERIREGCSARYKLENSAKQCTVSRHFSNLHNLQRDMSFAHVLFQSIMGK